MPMWSRAMSARYWRSFAARRSKRRSTNWRGSSMNRIGSRSSFPTKRAALRLSWTLAASLLTTGLEAAPLDWVSSQEELSALSQLSAGYAAAMLCNREIKIEIAEQFLQARFGDKRFSAAQFADVMFLVAG